MEHNRRASDNQSAIRAILRSEITWILFLIGGVISFYNSVVIPLKELQVQVLTIQRQINDEKDKFDKIYNRLNTLEETTSIIKTKIDLHI